MIQVDFSSEIIEEIKDKSLAIAEKTKGTMVRQADRSDRDIIALMGEYAFRKYLQENLLPFQEPTLAEKFVDNSDPYDFKLIEEPHSKIDVKATNTYKTIVVNEHQYKLLYKKEIDVLVGVFVEFKPTYRAFIRHYGFITDLLRDETLDYVSKYNNKRISMYSLPQWKWHYFKLNQNFYL